MIEADDYFMSLKIKSIITCLFLLFLGSDELYSQKRNYSTTEISSDILRIDGVFNESVWDLVEWSGDFVQLEPYEKKPPSQQTRFKILYDNNNIYIAIRCFDSAPDSIVKRMSRRDDFDGDWVEVNIDSYHDLRTGFSFTMSAAGVKGDEAITNDGNWDSSWDPIWYGKVTIDELGWTVEMRIPLSQLRFGKQEEYIWGLQVNRFFFRKQERSSWQFISPNATGWVHNFGELYGIKNIKPQKQKDIVPYMLGRFERYKKEEGNPFADGRDIFGTIGVDGKIGITNDLTLDFSINPDFGQVEADPSEVNLTTFETFFMERRPFFIEGKNILSFGLTGGDGPLSNDNLFYSRRIGKPPGRSLDLEENEFADIPSNTTILGAFKLAGKTHKGWSIGILESITQREKAEIDFEGQRRITEVEPFTNYFAGRIQRDMNSSNTRIGGMLTATNRDLRNNELLNIMHSAAYSGGIDFNQQWKNKMYYLNFSTVFSHVQGSEKAIYKTQTSAPHFFQRTDASYLEADSSLKNITGWGGNIQFGKAGNGKWMYTTWITWRSPGFNVNDIGYVRRNDEIQQIIWFGFRQREPFSIFRNFNLNINQWYALTFGFEKRYLGGNFNAHWTFKNYWQMGGGISREGKSISTTTLRGGPSLLYDGNTFTWIYLNTDRRKKIQVFLNYQTGRRDYNTAFSNTFDIGMNVQFSDAFRFSIQPLYTKQKDDIVYVENVDYQGDKRYIRANIDQAQLYMIIRLNYNITPDFTIQYYGMPFISAGKYSTFKYITDSKAGDFKQRYIQYSENQLTLNDEIYEVDEDFNSTIDYTFDNPNFNIFDFNSNLVIRWEYNPGSTVYLIWSQNRNNSISDGNFSVKNDSKELFSIYPHDVFLIKLSYRFGL